MESVENIYRPKKPVSIAPPPTHPFAAKPPAAKKPRAKSPRGRAGIVAAQVANHNVEIGALETANLINWKRASLAGLRKLYRCKYVFADDLVGIDGHDSADERGNLSLANIPGTTESGVRSREELEEKLMLAEQVIRKLHGRNVELRKANEELKSEVDRLKTLTRVRPSSAHSALSRPSSARNETDEKTVPPPPSSSSSQVRKNSTTGNENKEGNNNNNNNDGENNKNNKKEEEENEKIPKPPDRPLSAGGQVRSNALLRQRSKSVDDVLEGEIQTVLDPKQVDKMGIEQLREELAASKRREARLQRQMQEIADLDLEVWHDAKTMMGDSPDAAIVNRMKELLDRAKRTILRLCDELASALDTVAKKNAMQQRNEELRRARLQTFLRCRNECIHELWKLIQAAPGGSKSAANPTVSSSELQLEARRSVREQMKALEKLDQIITQRTESMDEDEEENGEEDLGSLSVRAETIASLLPIEGRQELLVMCREMYHRFQVLQAEMDCYSSAYYTLQQEAEERIGNLLVEKSLLLGTLRYLRSNPAAALGEDMTGRAKEDLRYGESSGTVAHLLMLQSHDLTAAMDQHLDRPLDASSPYSAYDILQGGDEMSATAQLREQLRLLEERAQAEGFDDDDDDEEEDEDDEDDDEEEDEEDDGEEDEEEEEDDGEEDEEDEDDNSSNPVYNNNKNSAKVSSNGSIGKLSSVTSGSSPHKVEFQGLKGKGSNTSNSSGSDKSSKGGTKKSPGKPTTTTAAATKTGGGGGGGRKTPAGAGTAAAKAVGKATTSPRKVTTTATTTTTAATATAESPKKTPATTPKQTPKTSSATTAAAAAVEKKIPAANPPKPSDQVAQKDSIRAVEGNVENLSEKGAEGAGSSVGADEVGLLKDGESNSKAKIGEAPALNIVEESGPIVYNDIKATTNLASSSSMRPLNSMSEMLSTMHSEVKGPPSSPLSQATHDDLAGIKVKTPPVLAKVDSFSWEEVVVEDKTPPPKPEESNSNADFNNKSDDNNNDDNGGEKRSSSPFLVDASREEKSE